MQILAEEVGNVITEMITAEKLFPLFLIVIIISWLMWSARRRLQGRGHSDEETPIQRQPSKVQTGSKEQIRRDLESLIAELQDLSRKISAEIDTRFVKLEAAMHDADRRIATLNRLSRSLAEKMGDAKKERHGEDVRYTVIYELADAGSTPVEIARELGKTPGEVELILNLRRQAESNPADPPQD